MIEEDRICIHCEAKFQIRYSSILGKAELCPFCGSETEVDLTEEDGYSDENQED